MSSYNDPPFIAGGIISNPRYFVGYEVQLDTITIRATSIAPTSINIVGDRRIGKSSLLYHFCQTYEQRVESRNKKSQNFLAVYVTLQQSQCWRKSGFYQVIAESLSEQWKKKLSFIDKNKPQIKQLIDNLDSPNLQSTDFEEIILMFQRISILPIICLDKIETLFEYTKEFNIGFYDHLRSLMDRNALMLVISSYQTLGIYSKKHQLTSTFFNLGHTEILEGFSDNEARDLVRLPKSKVSHLPEALAENKQKIALQWGNKHPYLLQLACLCLWDAQQLNRDLEWAEKKFKERKANINSYTKVVANIRNFCRQILKHLLRLPIYITRRAEYIGNKVGQIIAIGIGLVFILLVILAIGGFIAPKRIPKQFNDFLCSTLSSVLDFCEDGSIQ